MPRSLRIAATLFLVASLTALRTDSATADEPPLEEGFVAIFNGRNLDGWSGDASLWSVRDGLLVGDSPGIKRNEFLSAAKRYGDFELRLEFRLRDGQGNSGIQIRSEREPNSTAMIGYQADVGQQYWGCLYDEHRRNKVLAQAPPELDKVLKKGDWNSYVVRAEGDRLTLTVNGLQTVDYRETDPKIPREGLIAVQIHSGPPMKIEFRRVRIKELKSP